MSGLSQLLRRVTDGRWPRRREPRVDRPHFDCFKRMGTECSGQRPLAEVHSAETLTSEHFWHAPTNYNRLEHLHDALSLAPAAGYVLEFGVFRGGSLNWLARWSERRLDPRVFGFDSFAGLPEEWVLNASERAARGCFALPQLPQVLTNARLVTGLFEETLPAWLAAHSGSVSFVHLDADLYSATRCALTLLDGRLAPGAILVFDELGDWTGQGKYDRWREGEWRALIEWLQARERRVQVLSRTQQFAAAVRLVI